MIARLRADIAAVKERDPACTSSWSALTNYPGLWAVWWHRVTHRLHRKGFVWLARFFIDHGMGVVIGETTVIADDVTLYQGVTLGGTGKEHGKRHPTLEDFVVVGVGATVLGNIRIGRGTRVGAGAVVIADVPGSCTVVGIPGRVVVREGQRVDAIDLHHEDLPAYRTLQRRMDRMEARLARDEDTSAEAGTSVFGEGEPRREDDDDDPRL